MKKSASTGNRLVPVAFAAVLLLIWEGIVDAGLVQRFILPSPWDVLVSFITILPTIGEHLTVTLREALTGFLFSILLALVLAVVMDSLELVRKALYPLLVISQTIPIIALAPLFVIWLGFGELPKIVIVVLVCFFPIVVSLMDGLNSVEPDMLNLMRSMGAGKMRIFRLVKFPASMVHFFSGLRIAATYSIMGAVVGEWLGGEKGLGVYMQRVKHSYALDKVFAVTLLIIILSMIIFQIILVVERLTMPWHRISDKKYR